MTTDPKALLIEEADKLLASLPKDNDECRLAFERWYFQRRKEWLAAGVELSDADTNSMWDGWQGCWSVRPTQPDEITPYAKSTADWLRQQIRTALIYLRAGKSLEKAIGILERADRVSQMKADTPQPDEAELRVDETERNYCAGKVGGAKQVIFDALCPSADSQFATMLVGHVYESIRPYLRTPPAEAEREKE